jgi:hypothetical protein
VLTSSQHVRFLCVFRSQIYLRMRLGVSNMLFQTTCPLRRLFHHQGDAQIMKIMLQRSHNRQALWGNRSGLYKTGRIVTLHKAGHVRYCPPCSVRTSGSGTTRVGGLGFPPVPSISISGTHYGRHPLTHSPIHSPLSTLKLDCFLTANCFLRAG